ncbi:VMAP-C domain-containing protein [Azohydromonas australica]|uniref:VMAP-C domain-containing protein n=1 Tax=Azohydromonas australica TaxID=364039 RepID=UPI0012EB96AA|nr:hypothetical protein [Azohydromonas australica]
MKPICDPSRAFVVIVGVEASRLFDLDPLIGPTADAIRCFEWAVQQKVQISRIRMFISAKEKSELLLKGWQTKYPGCRTEEATEQLIGQFIAQELPTQAKAGEDALLLLMWSGHGLIDQRSAARTRRLFFSDATPLRPLNLEVLSLLTTLKGQRYAGFTQQIIMVDACATFSGRLFGGNGVGNSTNLGASTPASGINQWVMLGASPGQLAQTEASAETIMGDATAGASKFTNRLFRELDADKAQQWPDFHAAFTRTQTSFRDEDQLPVSWAHGTGDDTLSDDGLVVLGTSNTTRLARAVLEAKVESLVLEKCFIAALKPAPLAESHRQAMRDGLFAMIELLNDAAQPSEGMNAMQRFAAQVVFHAGELPSAEVLTWLKRGVNEIELHRYRSLFNPSETSSANACCFLLIDEHPNAIRSDAVDLQAWLFIRKDPLPILLTDDESPLTVDDDMSRAEALGTLLGSAFAEALHQGITMPAMVVEFALPLERIDDDVEKQRITDGAGGGRIGRRYPVVRRLSDRLRQASMARTKTGKLALPLLFRWIKAAEKLRQRFEQHGLQVVWMSPDDVMDDMIDRELAKHPLGSCIGLRTAAADRCLSQLARKSLQSGALPFACWSHEVWTEEDTKLFEGDMRNCPDYAALLKIFDLKREAGFSGHPSTKLAILWDDPARNPYIEQLRPRGTSI